jgi:hypothetical protein
VGNGKISYRLSSSALCFAQDFVVEWLGINHEPFVSTVGDLVNTQDTQGRHGYPEGLIPQMLWPQNGCGICGMASAFAVSLGSLGKQAQVIWPENFRLFSLWSII